MPLGCVILEGGGNAELRAWKAFGQWVNTIRKASPKSVFSERALYAARKIVTFIQGGDTFSKKVMEDLSSAERKSFVDESSSIVPSLLKRECVGANCQMLSERVRRLSERALQKGLDCSRRAKHKWLSQALKGGAGPAHRWCGKEDALPEPPLVVRDSQGNFTADPQCEAELYAHEWKREWGGEDAIGIVKKISSFLGLRENMSQNLVSGLASSIYGLEIFAKLVSLSRPKRLSVSTSTGLQTSHSSPIMLWSLWARSSDNILLSWQYLLSHFCNCWSSWARKWREQNYRHLARNISPHPCAWYQHTTVDGMSSLQVSGILRLKVTQRSEHMLQGRWPSSWPT